MKWLLMIFCLNLTAMGKTMPLSQPMILKKISVERPLAPGSNALLVLELSLKQGHSAYVDQFSFSAPGIPNLKNSKLKLSPVNTSLDPHSEKTKEFVSQDFQLETVIELPEDFKRLPSSVDLELKYQACTKKFCYSPKTLMMKLPH